MMVGTAIISLLLLVVERSASAPSLRVPPQPTSITSKLSCRRCTLWRHLFTSSESMTASPHLLVKH